MFTLQVDGSNGHYDIQYSVYALEKNNKTKTVLKQDTIKNPDLPWDTDFVEQSGETIVEINLSVIVYKTNPNLGINCFIIMNGVLAAFHNELSNGAHFSCQWKAKGSTN